VLSRGRNHLDRGRRWVHRGRSDHRHAGDRHEIPAGDRLIAGGGARDATAVDIACDHRRRGLLGLGAAMHPGQSQTQTERDDE
jgi:hypothetical protein